MILKRRKHEFKVVQGYNPDYMQIHFHGNHWSFFFPDVLGILKKGMPHCTEKEKSEGEVMYSIGTDEFWHNLECPEGTIHLHDVSFGLSITINKKNEILLQKVVEILESSRRFIKVEPEEVETDTKKAPNKSL